jgi:hypothetical protein
VCCHETCNDSVTFQNTHWIIHTVLCRRIVPLATTSAVIGREVVRTMLDYPVHCSARTRFGTPVTPELMVYKGSQVNCRSLIYKTSTLRTLLVREETKRYYIYWRILTFQLQHASFVFGEEKGFQESVGCAICWPRYEHYTLLQFAYDSLSDLCTTINIITCSSINFQYILGSEIANFTAQWKVVIICKLLATIALL